jgi:hypothetical protein
MLYLLIRLYTATLYKLADKGTPPATVVSPMGEAEALLTQRACLETFPMAREEEGFARCPPYSHLLIITLVSGHHQHI